MALVRGEDDESDSEETPKRHSHKLQEKKEAAKGKLVDGEESETDDEDAYHDPEIMHTEANIRVKGTNFTSLMEGVGEADRVTLGGDTARLSESSQQKKLGEVNKKLRRDLTTSILSTYQRAIHKADQVGDQLGKSQQITGKCMDELKQTSLHLDRLTQLISTRLNQLPELKTIKANMP